MSSPLTTWTKRFREFWVIKNLCPKSSMQNTHEVIFKAWWETDRNMESLCFLETQQAHLARMSEGSCYWSGKDKDVYFKMSPLRKTIVWILVWGGVGCHKDLNVFGRGYFAMSKWWEEHKQTPPTHLQTMTMPASGGIWYWCVTITPAQGWWASRNQALQRIQSNSMAGARSITRITKKGITIFFLLGGGGENCWHRDIYFSDKSNTVLDCSCWWFGLQRNLF